DDRLDPEPHFSQHSPNRARLREIGCRHGRNLTRKSPMSETFTFRELTIDDLPLIADIDRSETIDAIYTCENGHLTLHEKRIDVQGWYPSAITDHISDIGNAIANGGAAF